MPNRKAAIKDFLVKHLDGNPARIVRLATNKFQVSRQLINRYLNELIEEGMVYSTGNTRSREYHLKDLEKQTFTFSNTPEIAEHIVWRTSIRPLLEDMAPNIIKACEYGFTEIFNNAIDHSEGSNIFCAFYRNAAFIEIVIMDDGVGIFKKIKREFQLEDERHAIFELAKGKLTTDPKRHSGEGIFFTSRVFTAFSIMSYGLAFMHTPLNDDWLLEDATNTADKKKGTFVRMQIDLDSKITTKEVFDKYTLQDDDDYGFDKTKIPISLLKYGDENLVSRSQAKRLVTRFDRFKEVWLDFKGVTMIGQAFADEVFRVFQQEHSEVALVWINANKDVEKMIRRARGKLEGGSAMQDD